jgi:hypothetical protein
MRSQIRVRLTLVELRGTDSVLRGIFDRVSPVLSGNEALRLFEELLLRVSRGRVGLWQEPEAPESK